MSFFKPPHPTPHEISTKNPDSIHTTNLNQTTPHVQIKLRIFMANIKGKSRSNPE
jgi:hypothetical protein